MATTRLRKAFRYPEDSDNEEHEREELDEEGTLSLLYINTSERALTKPTEQERVVEQLQRQNNQRNSQYSVICQSRKPDPVLSRPNDGNRLFSLHSPYFRS